MSSTVVLRPASPADASSLHRLAVLDSSVAPRGEVVMAFRGTEPVAAVSVTDGHVVADPFARTADVVDLLREHVRGVRTGRGRRREWLRSLRPASAA